MLTVNLLMPNLGAKILAFKAAARMGLQESVPIGAALIVDEAKMFVRVESGNLREHIHSEELESTENRVIHQIAPSDEAGNEYGFDPAYARRLEYGFFGADKLGREYHQAAQPFMRPAKDGQGPNAVSTIKRGVLDAVGSV